MLEEQWRSIVGYEGLYEVSTRGRVRSLDRVVQHRKNGPTKYRGKILKQHLSVVPGKQTYWHVSLSVPGKQPHCYNTHTLVLNTFVGPAPAGCEGCHGPAGSENNSLENLRWDTRLENAADIRRWGKRK